MTQGFMTRWRNRLWQFLLRLLCFFFLLHLASDLHHCWVNTAQLFYWHHTLLLWHILSTMSLSIFCWSYLKTGKGSHQSVRYLFHQNTLNLMMVYSWQTVHYCISCQHSLFVSINLCWSDVRFSQCLISVGQPCFFIKLTLIDTLPWLMLVILSLTLRHKKTSLDTAASLLHDFSMSLQIIFLINGIGINNNRSLIKRSSL